MKIWVVQYSRASNFNDKVVGAFATKALAKSYVKSKAKEFGVYRIAETNLEGIV